MGLSGHLQDVSGDSIPLLLLAALAASISYLRTLLHRLLHHHNHHPSAADVDVDVDASSLSAHLGSGLAGLVVLADHLASNPSFAFSSEPRKLEEREGSESGGVRCTDCVVCLCGVGEGEHVRRLSCRHAFHSECLDGWFLHQMNLSCPLCRSPQVAPELHAAAERRIGAELIAWLSPY